MGRVPIGATPERVPFAPEERGGEPLGEELEVRLLCWSFKSAKDCWAAALLAGDAVLLARSRGGIWTDPSPLADACA